jgi:hypothetical protein
MNISASNSYAYRSERKTGYILTASSISWLVGALGFMPVLEEVYSTTIRARQIAIIQDNGVLWILQNLFFLSGCILAAIGTYRLSNQLKESKGVWLGVLASYAAFLSLAVWLLNIAYLVATPLLPDMPINLLSLWHYSVMWKAAATLTLSAAALIGCAFIRASVSVWLSLFLILASTGFIALTFIWGSSLPPVLFFQLFLILGLFVLVRKPFTDVIPNS